MPSAGERRYGNASSRSARTNASCSSRGPSLASTIPSQSRSRRAIERSIGRSALQTGQVGERKKRSVLRPPALGPPTSRTVPADGGARAAAVDVPPAARQVDGDRRAVDEEEGRGGEEARRPRPRDEEGAGRGRLRRDQESRGGRRVAVRNEAILGDRRPEAAR